MRGVVFVCTYFGGMIALTHADHFTPVMSQEDQNF